MMPGRRRSVNCSLLFFVCGMFLPAPLHAQYDEPTSMEPLSSRYASLGILQRGFHPRPSNPLGDSAAIQYERIMPLLVFRQSPIEIMLGYTRYTLFGERRDAIFFGATFTQDVIIAGSKNHALFFPVILTTDFTKSEAAGPQRETFNIVSVGGGGGLKYRHVSQDVDFSFSGVFTVLYSSEGLGTGTGVSTVSTAESVLFLKGVALLDGVVLGYRLRNQTWTMSQDKFDYSSFSHGPFLGVIF